MKIKITEEEKKEILELHNNKRKNIQEQSWLRKLIGSSVDDLLKYFGDDSVKTIETMLSKALSKQVNYVAKNGQTFLKSMSGVEYPMDVIEDAIKIVSQGRITPDEVAQYLPERLADGSEFKQVFRNSFSKKVTQDVGQIGNQKIELPSWMTDKWFFPQGNSKPYITSLFEKAHKLEKLKFDPSKIKILNKVTYHSIERGKPIQRDILELKFPTGDEMIIYRSSGTGAPELKKSGDWQVIPGWNPEIGNPKEISWFVKDEGTTQLTQGLNPYLTQLDNFLKINGVNKLGK